MTKKKKPEKNPKQLPKPDKSEGPMTLTRLTSVDNIIKKSESQP